MSPRTPHDSAPQQIDSTTQQETHYKGHRPPEMPGMQMPEIDMHGIPRSLPLTGFASDSVVDRTPPDQRLITFATPEAPLGSQTSVGRACMATPESGSKVRAQFFTSRMDCSDTSEDEDSAMYPSTPSRLGGRSRGRRGIGSSSMTSISPGGENSSSPSKRKGKGRLLDEPSELQMDSPSVLRRSPRKHASTPSSNHATPVKKYVYRFKGNVTPSRAYSIFKTRKKAKVSPTKSAKGKQEDGALADDEFQMQENLFAYEKEDEDGFQAMAIDYAQEYKLRRRRKKLPPTSSTAGVYPLAVEPLRTTFKQERLLHRMRTGGVGGGSPSSLAAYSLYQSGAQGAGHITRLLSKFNSDPVLDCYHIPNIGQGFEDAPDSDDAAWSSSEASEPLSEVSQHSLDERSPHTARRDRRWGRYWRRNYQEHLSPGHPLVCEYSHASSATYATKQWLAVGSSEGRVSLIDTGCDPETREPNDWDNWRIVDDRPSFHAADCSIFSMRWRQDDRILATGHSDYEMRLWDPETSELLGRYDCQSGSPRSISFDPNGNGNLVVTGGRDGAIHLFDTRCSQPENGTGKHCEFRTRDSESAPKLNLPTRKPVLSIWNAHALSANACSWQEPLSAASMGKMEPKGVTGVDYLPGRQHNVISVGCTDATVKLWDFRSISSQVVARVDLEEVRQANIRKSKEKKAQQPKKQLWRPIERTEDLSLQDGKNQRPHGLSSLVVGTHKLFTTCTDGRVYTLPTSSLFDISNFSQGSSVPVGGPNVCTISLYSKAALHRDERLLAVGSSTGDILVYDVGTDSTLSTPHPLLGNGHAYGNEINGVSWADGELGPTLASVGDDLIVRTWRTVPRQQREVEFKGMKARGILNWEPVRV